MAEIPSGPEGDLRVKPSFNLKYLNLSLSSNSSWADLALFSVSPADMHNIAYGLHNIAYGLHNI